ncbi:hypothetical protein ACFQOY_05485 [Enterococcus alcedinis]|uniref:Uncharacterized protein n=1 Tax=Enterococcus alcedinis TaxID=1274384 RepID=A0A917N4V5_9ENTE|nr:hypothetical protein [Enterococcus alcedinis]MBP2101872.1 hypothetical protein [Enterococcus alcedinis]GGI65434.1 hypothetical protein GCM10011482_10880 [Enterococcus alcedinis]
MLLKKSITGFFLMGVFVIGILSFQPQITRASESSDTINSVFSGGWIEGEGEFGNKPVSHNSLNISTASNDFWHNGGTKDNTTGNKTAYAQTFWRNVYHYSRAQLKLRFIGTVRVDSGRQYGYELSYAEASGVPDLVAYSYWGS